MKRKLLLILGGVLLFTSIFASENSNEVDGQDDDPNEGQPIIQQINQK